MKKIIFVFMLTIFFGTVYSQENSDIFSQIGQIFVKSDYQQLSDLFATTLDVTVENNDGTYGKQQALVLMKEFFKNNKIASFKIKHKGSSNERTHYAVCDMIGQEKKWSVYVLLDQDSKIIQLQIEE